MSRRSAIVVERIVRSIASSRIDQILVAEAKGNIDKSIEASGKKMEPLWADRYAFTTFRVGPTAKLNPLSNLYFPDVDATTHFSFRKDGKPLLDTRNTIYNRLSGDTKVEGRRITFRLRGPLVAIYHNSGFSTKGPNFIPLTRKARREHVKGVDPRSEGLREGVDFIMAWDGVTVPRRQFFDARSPRLLKRVHAAVLRAIKGIGH